MSRAPGRVSNPNRGSAPIVRSSSGCGPSASRLRDRAACRRTSSSMTPRFETARIRPTTVRALLTVKGVGARKAEDLGDTFLAAIRSHS